MERRCRSTFEVATSAIDLESRGYDTSYRQGDYASGALRIPATPTTTPQGRYLMRLCGAAVKEGDYIVGIEEWLYMGITLELTAAPDAWPYDLIFPVKDKLWRPANGNGNVVWGLRFIDEKHTVTPPVALQPGYSTDLYGTQPAIIVAPNASALAGVEFPGSDLGGLGFMHDMRFSSVPNLPMRIRAPSHGVVALFASVRQMGLAADRPVLTYEDLDDRVDGLLEEDKALLNAASVAEVALRYIGGRIVIEVGRCCGQCQCSSCGHHGDGA